MIFRAAQRLHAFASNERQTPPTLDPRRCHVGQWLDATTTLDGAESGDVTVLIGLHQQLHDLAVQMCEMKSMGLHAAVQAVWVDVRRAGDALLMHLQSMLPPSED